MHLFESLARDIRHACRLLWRRPGFAAAGIATLGIGLAVTTVAFTGVNALFIRGADGSDVSGAGWILFEADNPDLAGLASLREYETYARDVPSLDVSAQSRVPLSYQGPDGAETMWSLVVSSNYFELLDVAAEQGRLFDALPRDVPVVAISHRLWRDRLGSPALAGLTLPLNGLDVAVAAVLPEGHRGPGGFFDPAIWVRLDDWDALGLPPYVRDPQSRPLALTARLRGSATPLQADREIALAAQALAETWPDTNRGRTASFVLFEEGHPEMRQLAPVALAGMGLVALVLAVAVFNFAGLLLARAVDREREMRIRSAIGAGRLQIVRQLVVESLVVATLGGLLALVVAQWTNVLLATFAVAAPIPQRIDLTPDRSVVIFTVVVFVVSGVIAGLFPAYRATGLVVSGPRASRLRAAVVAVQLAGATVLLTAAAGFVGTALEARGIDVGFESSNVFLMEVAPSSHGHTAASARRMVDQLRERLAGTPGVRQVAVANRFSFYVGFPDTVEFTSDGRSCAREECPTAGSYRVGPGYFAALGIPIRRGREFNVLGADAGAVIISEAMARQLGPRDPIGRRIAVGEEGRRMEIVGVAADVLHRTLRDSATPYVYLPLEEATFSGPVTLIAATTSDPAPLLPVARAHLGVVDPRVPAAALQTMAQRLDDRARRNEATIAKFFLILGGLAIGLAAVGLSATVSYAVGQRTREFGVRSAVGASPSDLRRLVLRDGLLLALPGVLVGLLGGWALLRAMGGIARALDLTNPVPMMAVALFQIALTLAVSAIPGRRAAAISPLAALRTD